MESLFDNLVDDFAKTDDSHQTIVSRSALQLVKRGFLVTSIRLLDNRIERLRGGITFKSARRTRIWRIEIVERRGTKTAYLGYVDIAEIILKFKLREGEEGTLPRDKTNVTFTADCAATEKKLSARKDLTNEDSEITKPKRAGVFLVANRVARRKKALFPFRSNPRRVNHS